MNRTVLNALATAAALFALPALAAKPGTCADRDRDGYTDASCGGTDCNDADASIHPGAAEVCGDAKDNNCGGGVDEGCSGGTTHASLTWSGYAMCRSCHAQQAADVFASGHYQWNGSAPFNVNDPELKQGKYLNSINSYCVNVLGNWDGINAARAGACSACHVGRGLEPSPSSSATQLDNIDCLICHQDAYKRRYDAVTAQMVPDTAAMTITMDQAVRTIHRPTRASCLQCHAKAGGGDAVKRGDLTLAHVATADASYDVHMATTRGNLACTTCHTVQSHRIAGSGSDLRVVDLNVEMKCSQCHATKEGATGHATLKVNDHVARVACQTCHIPRYGRNAGDTAATEATETHRDWLHTHGTTPPIHPARTVANDLLPKYRFWSRYSSSGLLFDTPAMDPVTLAYPTSRPIGGINDAPGTKLYPFKYKTATQPYATNRRQLIAIDTSTFFATGNAAQAVADGLVNMGYPANEPSQWVTTDTFQLITHTVPPAATGALQCASCHENTAQMDLKALGYVKKAELAVICTQCHALRAWKGYVGGHDTHVTRKRKDCSICHSFTRPERGLSTVIR